MIKIVSRKKSKSGKYILRVCEVPASCLDYDESSERYRISSMREIEVSTEVRVEGRANSLARAKRLAKLNRASLLSDVDGINNQISSAGEGTVDLPDEPGEEEEEEEEAIFQQDDDDISAEVNTALRTAGFATESIEDMTHDTKLAISDAGLKPEEVFVTETGGWRRIRRRKKKIERDESSEAYRGFRASVRKPDWTDGSDFDIGQASERSDVERVARLWREQGYRVSISPLRKHHLAKTVINTLKEQPFSPIVCAVDGCQWVGEAIGSHLKTHGMSLEQYRDVYGYSGQSLVGSGNDGIHRARRTERERRSVRPGMFLVEAQGDSDAIVWRMTEVCDPDRYKIAYVSGTPEPVESLRDQVITSDELFKRFAPMGTWSRAVKRAIRQQIRGQAS